MSKKPMVFVRLGLPLTLLFAAAVGAQPPFTTTTIVNGNGTPIANGAALLAAVAAATPPALIKVEPGTYDLNGLQLVMRDRVDVEGSGRDVTFIVSSTAAVLSTATVQVPLGVVAELRQLTVQHISISNGIGIDIDSSGFLLTEVNVETVDGKATVGIQTNNSSPRLNEVFVRVMSQLNATGVRINGGGTVVTESFASVASEGPANIAWDVGANADAVLERVVAQVSGGKDSNIAVAVHGAARVELNNVRGVAQDATAVGLNVFKNGFAEVKECTFKSFSDDFSVALLIEGESASRATESTFVADSQLAHLAVFAVHLTGAANLDSNQSNYEGATFAAVNNGTGQGRFGTSQLIGFVSSSTPNGLQCIFTYRGNYTARNALCV